MDSIDELVLLLVVLVEEQVQLLLRLTVAAQPAAGEG
jgi:hypothetical protein